MKTYNIISSFSLVNKNNEIYANCIKYRTILDEEIHYKVIPYHTLFEGSIGYYDFTHEEYIKYMKDNDLGIKSSGVY